MTDGHSDAPQQPISGPPPVPQGQPQQPQPYPQQPQYVQPPYPQQPPAQSTYPHPPYLQQQRPANGTVGWALGFIVFVPFPFLSALAAGIAMAIPYGSQSQRGPVARENARAAANWGITFAIVSTVLVVLHFVLLFTLTSGGGVRDFYPLGIPITLYAVLILAHIVLVIVGTVRASSGKIMRVPFAIPFIRR